MTTALGPASPSPPPASAPGPDPIVDAPVRRVTFLEDRAQVHREGRVRLEPGARRIIVAGVSPLAVDRSVLARAKGARVLDARVVRRWRVGVSEAPADRSAVAVERECLDLLLRGMSARRPLLVARREQLERMVALQVEATTRELPWAASWEERWGRDLEATLVALRDVHASERAADLEAEDVQLRRGALDLRPARVDDALEAQVQVDLHVEAAGEVALELDYLAPCAVWRPIHRATLLGAQVRFECEGAVWQATGEDWTDVELLFSTARPTQRSEPPQLQDDLLRAQRRQEKKVAVAVREQAIQTTGEGQAQDSPDLPGVDDGGETRLLTGAGRATIASDGRLRRIPIATFSAAADVDRVARAERSALVHLRSKQENPLRQPILAGPVELSRESGFVGRGEVGFVAPGERFVLGWGADDAVRVRREVEEEREVARLTGRQTITRKVTLRVSNLDPRPVTFLLEERVPVSEVEQVKVTVDPELTRPAAQPDDQGIVSWSITAPARGKLDVKLVYRLVAASDVQGI